MEHTATYSPEDNKLRLYPACRLAADEYARVKAAGFKWAPKQELFVAPMWTPDREDLLIEMCGEIGDEDTSLAERAEAKADRLDDLAHKRADDARQAKVAVDKIADMIPMGQPILVGHHSEKRAQKDAEKIQSGMSRAVRMWDLAQYWKDRAAGAIHAAKYKERPDVRARRIKKIEAVRRKIERDKQEAEACLKLWTSEGLTLETARIISGRSKAGYLAVVENPGNGYWHAYDVLRPDGERYAACPAKTLAEVQEAARQVYPARIEHCDRWLAHYDNRLSYERAMLEDQGGILADRVKPEKGGACRCWVKMGTWLEIQKVNKVSVTVLDNWGNDGPDFTRTVRFDELKGILSPAEWQAHQRGETVEAPRAKPQVIEPRAADADEFDTMRQMAREGVKVVAAPQLFPTPRNVAIRMGALARIRPTDTVLEPSAGTGQLLSAIRDRQPEQIVAVEINFQAAEILRAQAEAGAYGPCEVRCADFLECNGNAGLFDRIVMNPPFHNGEDIKHIQHARKLLKPGGRLVAICANGPRQQAQLKPDAAEWYDLEPGTFAQQGTNVNTAIIVFNAD